MNMGFDANKTSVEMIKERAFGGTYIIDIYSGVNSKWYKKVWKEYDELKNIDQSYYCLNYDTNVNKYKVKYRTSLRFGENIGWINSIDPYGWFQWYFRYWLGRRSLNVKEKLQDGKELLVVLKVN